MKASYLLFIALCLLGQSVSAQQTLNLEQVKQLAAEHNTKMHSANNAIEQAQEQQKEAFTNYFPQVSATGMGFRSNKGMVKMDVNTTSLAQMLPADISANIPANIQTSMLDKGFISSVMAMQPVFAGGQIINSNKLARVGVQVSELQKRTSENEVFLNAEQYYWQIVTLKEKQKTLDAVGEMLKSLEKDADIAIKAGVALRNDLLQVQLKQNEVESNKIKVQNGLNLSRMVLAQYIGMADQDIDVADSASPSQTPVYPASIKADHNCAVANTPEYQLLQKNVEATTLERKIETGKNLPSVGVGAGYSHTNLLDTKNDFTMIFATVSVPISSWWGGSHAIKRKKLAEQNARELLDDNAQLLKIRMQKNWNDVDDAYKQLLLAKKSIEQSEENLRLNRNFYHAGTVQMSDLLDAQQQYQKSRDQYTDAFSTLQTKILEYRQSIGK